jgi:hypothetical protein
MSPGDRCGLIHISMSLVFFCINSFFCSPKNLRTKILRGWRVFPQATHIPRRKCGGQSRSSRLPKSLVYYIEKMAHEENSRGSVLRRKLIYIAMSHNILAPMHGAHGNQHKALLLVHRIRDLASVIGRHIDDRRIFVEDMCHEIAPVLPSDTAPFRYDRFKNFTSLSNGFVDVTIVEKLLWNLSIEDKKMASIKYKSKYLPIANADKNAPISALLAVWDDVRTFLRTS